MHGLPGAGKTCSRHLLLNEDPPSSTDSTPIACPAVKATRISVDDKNKKWERVEVKDLYDQLASHLKEVPNETELEQKKDEASLNLDDIFDSSDDIFDSSDEDEIDDKTDDEPIEIKPIEKKPVENEQTEINPTKVNPTETEVVKKVMNAETSKNFSTNWVYFIDSGGQPAYRELLPLFTRAAALNIITIDLTKGLDEKCEFQYRIDQHVSPINTDLKYSNRDIICSTVSSEAMLNSIEIPYVAEPEKHKGIHARYLVLGTRKELVTEEELKEMDKSLISSSSLDLKNIIQRVPEKSIIFPVNTLLRGGSDERKKASIDLCTAISNCELEITIELPIRLLTFEIALQLEAMKNKQSFLTKEEVIEIGKSLRLDTKSDINDALQYLHNVTIILYYPAVLPNIIFVDPKPILDVLSRLIAITYIDQSNLHLIAKASDERIRLKKYGLFKEGLLEKIGQQKIFDKNFESSHMIKLLEHLHIIAKVINKDEKQNEYFFPCALPSCDKLNDPPTEIQPLLIAWEINNSGTATLAIPQGLFPLTIVHLLKEKNVVDFSPDPDSDNEFYRYHDAMSLRVYKDHFIHIINCYTHIKIQFRGNYKNSCLKIRELVTEAIEKSCKDLKCKNNYIFAFLKCPKKEHYCIVRKDDKSSPWYSHCTHCETQCKVLENDDSYRCWFFSESLLSSPGAEPLLEGPPTKRPTVQSSELDTCHLVEIRDLLKKHGYSGVDYYDLGLRLGLLPATLDVIEKDNKGDTKSCLRKCLTEWLEQKDNVKSKGVPTYDTLIQALRDEGENTVADGIEKDINSNKSRLSTLDTKK
ncbi:PREDICTED: uncharacterized protein LOC109589952 [Amphimedon queenslandica]|uniref:Death domain-containing protein n=1 Tax=Amphimedon queenslandica TaxID=400682 RepID=A0AAN0JX50_AMPQE|nr:PREDICTED: uncharacterized protein LOC109589952 [Amphimedon queenslandica]|eukprot:XP_019861480.1 PREDICTED: uncharacterized protein LOC109589952 [Amphimedon queenslandica]